MLSNFALFFANRAASGAVGSISRWATWSAVGAVFCICAIIFLTFALYLTIAPDYGPIAAASMIAGGSIVIGIACLSAPSVLDYSERRSAERARAKAGPIISTAKAVNEETAAAVDYFGPLQVVASAFIVGMRTAQQFDRSSKKSA